MLRYAVCSACFRRSHVRTRTLSCEQPFVVCCDEEAATRTMVLYSKLFSKQFEESQAVSARLRV